MPEAEDLVPRLAGRDAFVNHLGIELRGWGEGWAEVSLTVRPQHVNFNGTCHGGVLFTLADTAFGFASNSRGQVAIGIDAHMTFAAPARPGDVLTARAEELTRSRRLATYRIDLRRNGDRVIAGLTGTVLITGDSHGPA